MNVVLTSQPQVLKAFLAELPRRPGVYQMWGTQGQLLYVGKAKNLKQRVSSYFRGDRHGSRIAHMVQQICHIQFTVTRSEAEALLLESNYIKTKSPRYNILFRDDKTYPYLVMTPHPVARLKFYRGKRTEKQWFFGPYPNVQVIRDTIHLLQQIFQLRTCDDTQYANRSRPCLLHQINLCSAPCVQLISQSDYQLNVRHAQMFLQGRYQQVLQALEQRMQQAAEDLNFEVAALCRDQVRNIYKMQAVCASEASEEGILDVVVCCQSSQPGQEHSFCVHMLMIRQAKLLEDHSVFPDQTEGLSEQEVVSAFLCQYYTQHPLPSVLLLGHPILQAQEADVLEQALKLCQPDVDVFKLICNSSHVGQKWVDLAITNAGHALQSRAANPAIQRQRLQALWQCLPEPLPKLEHIECFDISHTSGQETMASCVVYDAYIMQKSRYRLFKLGALNADDYLAMQTAVYRRYRDPSVVPPDLIIIDGGIGQLGAAHQALESLEVSIPMVGLSKGESRRVGQERLVFWPDGSMVFDIHHPALQLLAQIRDEAHRFAVQAHRKQRLKQLKHSSLTAVPGVGSEKQRSLLVRFGSLQGVIQASVEELQSVPGIGVQLAHTIYHYFHHQEGVLGDDIPTYS